MIKTYKFRLYPTRKQEAILKNKLEIARFIYNKQLELKINEYKENQKNLSQYQMLLGINSFNCFLTKWKRLVEG